MKDLSRHYRIKIARWKARNRKVFHVACEDKFSEMIRQSGNIIIVQGPVNIYNVVDLTEQGLALLDSGNLQVDLQQVTEVDSTAISMLFEWLREASKKNCHLQFVHLPANLESLVQLYGVTDFIASLSNQ